MLAARRLRRSLGKHVPKVMRLAREADLPAGSVSEVIVEHDTWCRINRGGRCNCHPNVRLATATAPDADPTEPGPRGRT